MTTNSEWLMRLAKEAPDEPPEGDVVALLRDWLDYKINRFDAEANAIILNTGADPNRLYEFADMVERDYVSRQDFEAQHRTLCAVREQRDEWKAKAEAKSAKRAAAVKRLMKSDYTLDSIVQALVGWAEGSMSNVDAIIDLLTDEPMDGERDANGTCPDDVDSCEKPDDRWYAHGGVMQLTRENVEKLRGIVMPYHDGEKQAKLMGKQFDQLIYDELHDTREKLEVDGCKCPGYDPESHYCRYHDTDFELTRENVCKLKRENAALLAAHADDVERLDAIGEGVMQARVDSLTSQNQKLREKVKHQTAQLAEVQDALERRNNGELKKRWQKQVDELQRELDYCRKRYAERMEHDQMERDYWKHQVQLCMDSAYPLNHSFEQSYDPNVMGYPDRHGCTTPSSLVSAVIDGLRDERSAQYMALVK